MAVYNCWGRRTLEGKQAKPEHAPSVCPTDRILAAFVSLVQLILIVLLVYIIIGCYVAYGGQMEP